MRDRVERLTWSASDGSEQILPARRIGLSGGRWLDRCQLPGPAKGVEGVDGFGQALALALA
jgi:hypothetical protein